jgi:Na+/H+-dicarboxylate symporters
MKISFSLPLQLISVIIFVLIFGTYLSVFSIEICYTFSMLFKELLGMILPFMVFFFVSAGILSFKKNAPIVLGLLLSLVFISNGLVALLSYGMMKLFAPIISCEAMAIQAPLYSIKSLIPISLSLPFNAVHALVGAIIIGLLCSFIVVPYINMVINSGKELVEKILTVGFIPFLPLYVLGFLLQIRYEGLLACLIQQYGNAFLLIVSLQLMYLFWMYFIASKFSLKETLRTIHVAMPSYITAFSTMSSTATIPVSVKSATENTGNRGLSHMAIPIMANVHLLGDSIATPILAMTTLLIFQGSLPSFTHYLGFVFYFCTAMFAVSGIPGGGILVMIPILISQFQFSAEMVSIITTLYFYLIHLGLLQM